MKRTGAQIIWECLIKEGVEVVFGYPGGTILPAYDAMLDYPSVHHVLVRHEQGGTHMADGYARASGKVGVAFATSGPGATNMVTGIATAMMDSSPIVCITGQVGSSLVGLDAFQETDVTGVTLPITKHNYLVTRVEDIARTIREGFYIAKSGRPGPVLMLINSAKRPVILAGHGVLQSSAMQVLKDFAEKAQIPVAMSLLGIGGLPANHPLNLGMMGMHGEAWVNHAIQQADLLLAFGMRFDDRVTGNVKTYAPKAKKIHIEIDPSELNKVVKVDVALVGDLREVLNEVLPLVAVGDREEWIEHINEMKGDSAVRDIQNLPDTGHLYAAHVINDLWRYTEGEALICTDVGQHQMWTAQYYKHNKPFKLITSGGLGTMGFGLPSAIGAKFAKPNAEVWAISGDGGFQMTAAELSTAAQENIKVNVAIINNGYLGMVRQWQEFFYDKRYAATPMKSPDFVKLAEAHGLTGIRVTQRSQVESAIRQARETEGTVVIDFRVEKEDSVYPMVPAGADLHNMIRRPMPKKPLNESLKHEEEMEFAK
ncbi:MAG: acetolactate synthase large subunit [Chloroflexi bacterium]|nr:acetolactate synthase large subunit [Chloroflexota bacterium]